MNKLKVKFGLFSVASQVSFILDFVK